MARPVGPPVSPILGLLLVGCGAGVQGTDPVAGSTTASPETTTDGGTTTVTASSGSTSGSTSGADSTSGGEVLDPECFASDDNVHAAFAIEFTDEEAWTSVEGWITQEVYDVSLPCRVAWVAATDTGAHATQLECGPVDSPLVATLVHDDAPEGTIAWSSGDEVVLSSYASDGVFGGGGRSVALSSADGTRVLLAALNGTRMFLGNEVEAPITVDVDDEYCVEEGWDPFNDPPRSLVLTATTASEEITVMARHRAAVVADDGSIFVADVAVAERFYPAHGDRHFELLYQRVVAP